MSGVVLMDSVVVIDFETTGLNSRYDRATEVAALLVENGRIVDKYQTLINAGLAVPNDVARITGITTEMLRDAPRPREAFGGLREFISDRPVVAHNAAFDHGIYCAELTHIGLRRRPDPFICTKLLARRLLPGLSSYSLSTIANSLGVKYNGAAHRATPDAEVCAAVLHRLCEKIALHGIGYVEAALLNRVARYTPLAKAAEFLRRVSEGHHREKVDPPSCTVVIEVERIPKARHSVSEMLPSPEPVPVTIGYRDRVHTGAPPSESRQYSPPGAAARPALPPGWTYYKPLHPVAAAPVTLPEARAHSRPHEGPVPWYSEPNVLVKAQLMSKGRRGGYDWVYLRSHRCLLEIATGEVLHIYGWPEAEGSFVVLTPKGRPPISVSRDTLLTVDLPVPA